MTAWTHQLTDLIAPAVTRSKATDEVVIGHGVLGEAGAIAARATTDRRALVMADSAGFMAAGRPVLDALAHAGFRAEALVIPDNPLPKASVHEAEPFRLALAADQDVFPVSVGSGVINDLVKYAAFETGKRYMTVATAASMDGYTSAGAPLAKDGFKVTIPTRAPVAMLADLAVIAAAPAEMNGWGYGDLAGKVPAGGDWIVADALGVEPIDTFAWPLVQDHLRGWLDGPAGIAHGEIDALARLFVGLTAVGFAMEVHGSSRPASGADHQIAHLWEMEGHAHGGRKVSHGAAVAVGCVATLAVYDWLLKQDLTALDIEAVVSAAPDLQARLTALRAAITDDQVARRAEDELRAKHVDRGTHRRRLTRLVEIWPTLRARLAEHMVRSEQMALMLSDAGAPAYAHQIGITEEHLRRTMQAAPFIRERYTVFDLLHDTGLTETALTGVLPRIGPNRTKAAE